MLYFKDIERGMKLRFKTKAEVFSRLVSSGYFTGEELWTTSEEALLYYVTGWVSDVYGQEFTVIRKWQQSQNLFVIELDRDFRKSKDPQDRHLIFQYQDRHDDSPHTVVGSSELISKA